MFVFLSISCVDLSKTCQDRDSACHIHVVRNLQLFIKYAFLYLYLYIKTFARIVTLPVTPMLPGICSCLSNALSCICAFTDIFHLCIYNHICICILKYWPGSQHYLSHPCRQEFAAVYQIYFPVFVFFLFVLVFANCFVLYINLYLYHICICISQHLPGCSSHSCRQELWLLYSFLYLCLYLYCFCILFSISLLCISKYLLRCLSHPCRQEFVAVYLSYTSPRFKYAADTVDTCMGTSWQGRKWGLRLSIYNHVSCIIDIYMCPHGHIIEEWQKPTHVKVPL